MLRRRRRDDDEQPSTAEAVYRVFDDLYAPPRPKAKVGFVLAEVAVTIGLVVSLFVLWQVWFSDLLVSGDQDARVDSFNASVPAVDQAATDEHKRTTTPPAAREAQEGETIGVIYVPRWGGDYQVPVIEGTGYDDVLNRGMAGHYTSTEAPGEIGNFAVAGHRTTYGRVFHRVEELAEGDSIIVRTDSAWLVYKVRSTRVVEPWRNDVLAAVPGDKDAAPTQRFLTLTTCHPIYGLTERFIVHAELDHWVDPTEATPEEIA